MLAKIVGKVQYTGKQTNIPNSLFLLQGDFQPLIVCTVKGR
jgi:hypothetical protein